MTDQRITTEIRLELRPLDGRKTVALGFRRYEGMPEEEFDKLMRALAQSAGHLISGRVVWSDGVVK